MNILFSAFIETLNLIVSGVLWMLLIHMMLGWVSAIRPSLLEHPVLLETRHVLGQLVDKVCQPIRPFVQKLLPQVSMDLSPFALLTFLYFLSRILSRMV